MEHTPHPIKTALLAACKRYMDQRTSNARQAIAVASEAATDDTKSSAGDKFETTREMMQQEIDRHRRLLADAQRMEQVLASVDPRARPGVAQLGSLLETDRGTFFLAISVGRVDVDGKPYWVVSTAAPVGRQLLGKAAGDRFVFNDVDYAVIHVT